MSIDLLLGGRLLAAAQLGLYSVPRFLVNRVQETVNPIITRVAFPLIAEIQNDKDRVRSVFLKTLNMTASTNAPIYIAIAIFSEDVVRVILGEGWDESATILSLLALWGAIRSTGNPVGSLLLGMGRATLSLKWNLGLLLIIPPAVWVGAFFGVLGISWSLLIIQAALFIPGWFFLVRPLCHARLSEYSVSALRPLVIAAFAGIPAYYMVDLLVGSIYRLIVGIIILSLFYLILSYFLNQDWIKAVIELVGRSKVNAR
jgi:O-antigen/teichoic acid export membrane protein